MTTNNAFNKTIDVINLTNTTNQLVLGTTKTVTLNATAPASSLVYTIADLGASGGIVVTSNTTKTVTNGTWTPTLGDGTTNFICSTAVGTYTQFCDVLFFNANLIWTSKNGATGAAMVISLPTLPASLTSWGAYAVYSSGITYTNQIQLYITSASPARVQFYNSTAAGGIATLAASAFAASGQITIAGSYQTP